MFCLNDNEGFSLSTLQCSVFKDWVLAGHAPDPRNDGSEFDGSFNLNDASILDPARVLVGQKLMFYQSIKHGKSVFYCFARVKYIF